MTRMRLLRKLEESERQRRKLEMAYFLSWLNYGEPEMDPDWNRSEVLSLLRAHRFKIFVLKFLMASAADTPTTGVKMRAALAKTAQDPESEWRHLNFDVVEKLVFNNACSHLLLDLWKVRECACGCNSWFLQERKNQRYWDTHRKRVWQRKASPEQKERRRVQNREAQKRFYDRNFKAPPSA